ncbi:MAG: ATP-binding cassette domain-containing protein [Pseudobdellovibrio sp.]
MIFLKNLAYERDSFKLEIPFLEFKYNSFNVIIGPSGAGKTTLFNLIIGLLHDERWSFMIDGEELVQKPIEKRQLGVVFQNYELFPHLSAQDNILIVMKSRNNYNAETVQLLDQYKLQLNLDKCWYTLAENLSGGEKQRVALLRAVMSQPKLLLLDEPFSALDENNRNESRQLIKKFVTDLKLTTLLITHDQKDVEIFGDKVIRLLDGRLVD